MKNHEATKQYQAYEYYINNPDKSRKDVAEIFGVTVATLDVMMYNEKKLRGLVRSNKRG